MKRVVTAIWSWLAFCRCRTAATAAEIKVISAGAVRSVIAGMIEDYQKRSRRHLRLHRRHHRRAARRHRIRQARRSPDHLGAADGGARKDRQADGRQPRRPRPRRHRRGDPRGRDRRRISRRPRRSGKMLLDAQIGLLYRAGAGRHVGRAPVGAAEEARHPRRGHQEGDPCQRRHRHLAEGGARRGRDRHHADQRDRAGEGRAGWPGRCRKRCSSGPSTPRRSRRAARNRRRARLCRGADLAGDGGALDGGRFSSRRSEARSEKLTRASSSRSDCSSWRASSALIGSPKT